MKNKDIIEEEWQRLVFDGLLNPNEVLKTRKQWSHDGYKPRDGAVAITRVKLWIVNGDPKKSFTFQKWTDLFSTSQVVKVAP